MRTFFAVMLVVVGVSLGSPAPPVQAQCDWTPSSRCPAVSRRSASYPCLPGQIKGDWDTMRYHTPTQASYETIGADYYADVWCFATTQEALDYGFQRAFR